MSENPLRVTKGRREDPLRVTKGRKEDPLRVTKGRTEEAGNGRCIMSSYYASKGRKASMGCMNRLTIFEVNGPLHDEALGKHFSIMHHRYSQSSMLLKHTVNSPILDWCCHG